MIAGRPWLRSDSPTAWRMISGNSSSPFRRMCSNMETTARSAIAYISSGEMMRGGFWGVSARLISSGLSIQPHSSDVSKAVRRRRRQHLMECDFMPRSRQADVNCSIFRPVTALTAVFPPNVHETPEGRGTESRGGRGQVAPALDVFVLEVGQGDSLGFATGVQICALSRAGWMRWVGNPYLTGITSFLREGL